MNRRDGSQELKKPGRPGRFLFSGVRILLRRWKTWIPAFAPLFLASSIASAAGKTSGESLLTGAGARPAALAGAYTALAGDPWAIAYNPAGLARMSRPQLSFMHSQWLQDIQEQHLVMGIPLKPGVLGFSFYRMDMGRFIGRDSQGKQTQDFTASDMALSASFALPLHRRMLLGVKGAMFTEKIAGFGSNAFFGDVGFMFAATNKWVFGLAAQNLGNSLRFIEQASPLPATYALGTSYNLGGIRLAADYKMRANEGGHEFAMGAELAPAVGAASWRPLALRLGHNGFSQGSANNAAGLGMGFGLALGRMGVDYAFRPFGVLGDTHRMSLTFKF